MDVMEQLTRQSLLLEFISECVSLQSVPDLIKLIAGRLHWICEYDACSTLLPDVRGLSIWSQERKSGTAVHIDEEKILSKHRAALTDAMAKNSPKLIQSGDPDMFLVALPLGSRKEAHGALCVAKGTKGFSQGDIRHLQQALSAIGGALTRISALGAEHKADAALRVSEARYRTLFDSIDEGFCIIQFIDGPHGILSDYVHLEANAAYMHHAGISDIVGKTGRGELTESEADAWVAIFRAVLETGKPVHFERALEATNRYLEVSCSRVEPATKQQIAIVFQDVSARKRAEQKLQELNETLESQVAERTAERDLMWDTSPDLMLVIDFEGYFRQVNSAWTALLGYAHDELIGRHVNDFVIHSDHSSTVEAYEIAAEGGRPTIINRYRHKDGSIRWISWVAAPAGDMTYATGRDISAAKEREAELEQAQQALRQSQKMEAVGQLTGGLAHDFNNLLASISGSLQVLKLKLQRGECIGLDRYIDIGESSVRRAASLTQRLLAFSRQQTLDPKAIDVNRLIVGMEELVRRSIGPNIELEVTSAPDLWTTKVDPSQLENSLLNLCINACDAMTPGGGKLTLVTANQVFDECTAKEREMRPGEYISVFVSDTGAGMPIEVIARIFDPFYTTKPLGEGTGLGLSMVYGFLRQSGGQVRVHSEEGVGTTMCLYLPRFAGPVQAEERVETRSIISGDGETILLIEDQSALREIVEQVLHDAGYHVLTAKNGLTGLQILRSDVSIDLLVTDVGLPGGLNGRQVADAGRVVRPGLKVLFITGYVNTAAVGNGQLDHSMEVMTKPFEMSALSSKVRALIDM